ncbi:MAG: hypothetical protein MZV64_58390 [Ignavibacteriales bacterium]|nr:hypothetical protein [Ignavibacteriales bacterium]
MLAAQNTSGNGYNSGNNRNNDVVLPTKFELRQSSPNELNPTTRIDFAIPTDSKVSIKIYDSENKEVLTLLNDVRTQFINSILCTHLERFILLSFHAESGGDITELTEKMILTQ